MSHRLVRVNVEVECVADDLDGSLTREDAAELGVLRTLRRIVFGEVMMILVAGTPVSYEMCACDADRSFEEPLSQ